MHGGGDRHSSQEMQKLSSTAKAYLSVRPGKRRSIQLDTPPLIKQHRMRHYKEDCFKFAKTVLPHVGLVTLLTTYTVCGAAIFRLIEQPHEIRIRREKVENIWLIKNRLIDKLWAMAHNFSHKLDEIESVWHQTAFDEIDLIEHELFVAYEHRLVNYDDIRNVSRMIWSISGSIFFATTVITTIGYGHMVPVTLAGKIFCIFYALFGIPLLLITIADIGKFLSDILTSLFKWYYAFKAKVKMSASWSSKSGGSSSVVSENGQHSTSSSPVCSEGIFDSPSGVVMNHYDAANSEMEFASPVDGSNDEVAVIQIPIWMVLIFLCFYAALGGALFHYFEGWSYFEAFYFSFITMATIGFGDVVPHKERYIYVTLAYIIVGLALTTMGIDLAGTEYLRKIHYVGQKIETVQGIGKNAVRSGLHAAGGFVRQMRTDMELKSIVYLRKSSQQAFVSPGDLIANQRKQQRMLALYPAVFNRNLIDNVLYEPVSPDVIRFVKPNIKLLPTEIKESDALVVENKTFGKPWNRKLRKKQAKRRKLLQRLQAAAVVAQRNSSNSRVSWSSPDESELPLFIAPFILRESNV